jgi:hypothetical protein
MFLVSCCDVVKWLFELSAGQKANDSGATGWFVASKPVCEIIWRHRKVTMS